MRWITLILAWTIFSLQAQIGAKVQQQNRIFGVWLNNQFGYDITLILNADGSGEFDGEAIRFKQAANILSVISGV
jgi:hypothetical protein